MRGAAAAAAAVLLLPLLLLHAADASGGGNRSCVRRCGAMTMPYPFGFSPGCEIPLGCDGAGGAAWVGNSRELGLLVRNVTARTVVLTLLPNCYRRLNASIDALFSDHYAPAWQNGLVVSSCGGAAQADARLTNCSVPLGDYLDRSSHCSGRDKDSIRCVTPPRRPGDNVAVADRRFLNSTEKQKLVTECGELVTAVSYWDAPAPSLLLGTLELEWWVPGPCRCSSHANCTPVTTTSAREGHDAFRCECPEGFEGDGFADGAGCRRVPKCDTSKYLSLSGACRKTVQIALLMAGARDNFWRHGDGRDVPGVPPAEAAVGIHPDEAQHVAAPLGSLLRGALLLLPRDRARHQRLRRGPAPGHGRLRHRLRRPPRRQPPRRREAHPAARQRRRAGARHERGEAGVVGEPPQPGPPPRLLRRARAADPGLRVHAQRHAGGAPAAGARPRRRAMDGAPPHRRRDGQGHRLPALGGTPAHLPPGHQVQQHPARPRVQLQGRRFRAIADGQGVRGLLVAHLHGAAGHARLRGPAVPPKLPPLRPERRVQFRRRARRDHHRHEGRRLRQGAQRGQPGAARRRPDRQGLRRRHRRPVPGPAQGRLDAHVHPQGSRARVPVPGVPQRDEAVHGRGRRRAGADTAQRVGAVHGRRRVHVDDVVDLLLGAVDARHGQVVGDRQNQDGGCSGRGECGGRARDGEGRRSGVSGVCAGEVVQREKLPFLQ